MFRQHYAIIREIQCSYLILVSSKWFVIVRITQHFKRHVILHTNVRPVLVEVFVVVDFMRSLSTDYTILKYDYVNVPSNLYIFHMITHSKYLVGGGPHFYQNLSTDNFVVSLENGPRKQIRVPLRLLVHYVQYFT
jgi:hypothetical protein